jgi:hypothetical protein
MWLFELEHDGFRAVAYVSNGDCTLVSRKNHVYKSFALLRAAIAEQLRVEDAILDGEIVCLDLQGRSAFCHGACGTLSDLWCEVTARGKVLLLLWEVRHLSASQYPEQCNDPI